VVNPIPPDLCIGPLTAADADQTAAVVAEVFAGPGGEPMTRALGLSAQQYRRLTTPICADAAASGLGVIARADPADAGVPVGGRGPVVAFSIAERWPPPPYEPLPDSAGLRAGLELLLMLEREFDRRFAGDNAALHVFFVGCVPALRRRGVTRRLVSENLRQGRRAGLARAFAEATNDGSARLFESLGFATLAQVDYAGFEHAGARPFAGIADGRFGPAVKSCRLMAGPTAER
jgi:ribosomal protein S18 acetylase RimI-like enzyme